MDPAEFQRRIAEAQALKDAAAAAAATAAAATTATTPNATAAAAPGTAAPQQGQWQQQRGAAAGATAPPAAAAPPAAYPYAGAAAAAAAPAATPLAPSAAASTGFAATTQAAPAAAAAAGGPTAAAPAPGTGTAAMAAPQAAPAGLDPAQQLAWQQYQVQYQQWQQQQQQWNQYQEYQQRQRQQQQQQQQQQPQQQQQQHEQQQQQQLQPPQQQQQQHPQYARHQQQQQQPPQQQQPQQHQQRQTVYLGGVQPQQQQRQAPLLGATPAATPVALGGGVVVAAQQQQQPGQAVMDVVGSAAPGVAKVAPGVATGGVAPTALPAAPVYATPHGMSHPPPPVVQQQQQQGTYLQHQQQQQPAAAAAPVAYQAPGYAPPTGYAAYPQQQQQQQQQAYPQQQQQQHPVAAVPAQQQQQQRQAAPPVVMLPAAVTRGYPVAAVTATHAAAAAPPPGVVLAPHPQQQQQQPGYAAPPPQQMWGQQPVPQQMPMQPQQQQQQPQGFVQPPPGVIPTMPPTDPKDAEKVDKMAAYVARNGGGFEDIVREREKDNKMLSFIFAGELHEYYKWSLHCARMGFSPEQRHAQIGLYHHHKLMEKQAKEQAIQRMVASGEMVPGANLTLDAQNEQQFELLLKQLVGSQDSIQASKDWVVSRLGHYAVNIAWRLRVFAKETEVAAGGEGPKALPRSKACDKVIHVLYLANDVLFSIQHHPAADIFKAECLRQVPGILRSACTLDPELTGGSLDKVERIVRLWGSNGVFTPAECDSLLAAGAGVTAKHASAKAMAKKAAHGLRERAGRGGWDREGSGSGVLGVAGPNGEGDAGIGTGTLAQPMGDPESEERRKRQEERAEQRKAEEKAAEDAMERALARVKALAEGPAAAAVGEAKAGVGLPLAVVVQAVPTLAPAPETMPACHVQYPWRGALYPVMGKAQSVQSDNASKFPVAAGLASTAHGTDNMLEKLPVGTMAGILRVSLRNGFRRYKPVDIKLLPKYVTPHIEPGRLDVRVDEFYSRATLEQVHEERKKEKEQRKLEEERKLAGKEGGGGGGGQNDRGRRNRDDGFGAGGSQQGLRAKQAQLELESDMQGREKVLGEENIGHNLLKKMGWSEGTGLGSSRSGMVEPISGSGQMDKSGIGGGDGSVKKKTAAAEQDAFEAYRRNKSYSFRRF